MVGLYSSGIALIVVQCLLGSVGLAKEIALTFDDAPRGDTQYFSGKERTAKLVSALRSAQVREAAFFCNTHSLNKDGWKRVQRYSASGHLIANHTHAHSDFHQTSLQSFTEDFEIAHRKLSFFPTFRKWFRFPYLREGETVAKRDSMRAYLKKRGYVNGYVTVDTYDWYMDSLFQKALQRGKPLDLSFWESRYVKVLSEGVEFYNALAERSLQRSLRHVLLLHENDLAALFVPTLAKALRAKGWKIVTASHAYRDPIATEIPDTLHLGQGRVVALARQANTPGPYQKWEDEPTLDRLFTP
jgi:peptidoglycan-N-acetylglucosamine deacetylase